MVNFNIGDLVLFKPTKKGKEKALAEQGKESERVDIGGKEVVVDKNRPDSVRDLEKALDNIDDQWRDESDEDYQKRVGEAIKSHISKLNNKQKFEIMKADVFDVDDELNESHVRKPTTFMKHFKKTNTDKLRSTCCGKKTIMNIY